MKTRLFIFIFSLGLFILPNPVLASIDNWIDESHIDCLVARCQKLKPDVSPDVLRDFMAKALLQVEATGSLRISSRSPCSNAAIFSFGVGVAAGVATVAVCCGAFYLYACNQELPVKKEYQSDIPENFPQKNNWCWMVATLHSLYPLRTFRQVIDKKASEDLSVVAGMDKARIEFAQQLKDLFEKMETYAQTKLPTDEKKRTLATQKFYDRLFEIKKEYDIEMCPEHKCGGYGCDSFWEGLQYFLFQEDNDSPSGLVFSDRVLSTPFVSEQASIEKCLEWFGSFQDDAIIESKKIIPFVLNRDESFPTIINEKISLLEKDYSLKSIVIRRPGSKDELGHCTASVIYDQGSWYFFNSFARERKELSAVDVQSLLNGQGYAGFKPKLVFYSQI
jgi:hypothetical protein